MKRNAFITVFFLCLVFFRCLAGERNDIDRKEVEKLLGQAYVTAGDYQKAETAYRQILEKNPKNIETRIALADILSWQKRNRESIAEYKKVLEVDPDNREVKIKLAAVLSWDKQYGRALELYDEILNEKEDSGVRLQKARVLSWTRRYRDSLKEYEKAAASGGNSRILLEKRAKEAYWSNRLYQAIDYYIRLLDEDPENAEARFDLSQIYSYQSMGGKAIGEYQKIIDVHPEHFRAKEGLQKVELISRHVAIDSGYEFFESDSQDRVNDINRHTFFNRLSIPLKDDFTIEAGYSLGQRSFSDFDDLTENESRIGFIYSRRPDWQIAGFYDFIEYNRDIDTQHNFGAGLNYRFSDIGVSSFSFERERLENSSQVIRGGYYRDNYKGRLDFDLNGRVKLGMDYLYSGYSDDNYKNEFGIDGLFYFLFDPTRFTIDYRYFFRDFDNTNNRYFSPRDFSTHHAAVTWRHFLNREEIYFGADDLYYQLCYDISADSDYIVSHKFSAEINWDLDKRLSLNAKASYTNSSASVYKDRNFIVSIKYYF